MMSSLFLKTLYIGCLKLIRVKIETPNMSMFRYDGD